MLHTSQKPNHAEIHNLKHLENTLHRTFFVQEHVLLIVWQSKTTHSRAFRSNQGIYITQKF